jgi:hypothetical protein
MIQNSDAKWTYHPTFNYPPGLYALANVYIETNLSKNDPEIAAIRRDGWADVPLSFKQVKYAAQYGGLCMTGSYDEGYFFPTWLVA